MATKVFLFMFELHDMNLIIFKEFIGLLFSVLFKETESDFDNCAVCIEGYKPNDVVRILPCR